MEKQWFKHNIGSRNDPKLVELELKFGCRGRLLFWDIVELIFEQQGDIPDDGKHGYILKVLNKNSDTNEIIDYMIEQNLFYIKDGLLQSRNANEQLKKQRNITKQRKLAVQVRESKRQSNDKQMINKSSSIKRREEKKRKEENRIDIDPKFQDVYNRFIEYRKAIKRPYKSNQGRQAFYNKLLQLSSNNPETAMKIVEQSIANEYQGIFELKQDKNNNNQVILA